MWVVSNGMGYLWGRRSPARHSAKPGIAGSVPAMTRRPLLTPLARAAAIFEPMISLRAQPIPRRGLPPVQGQFGLPSPVGPADSHIYEECALPHTQLRADVITNGPINGDVSANRRDKFSEQRCVGGDVRDVRR